MPRFAANLTMMYPEHDFLDRFAAAARDGFEAVEYLFPYAYEKADLAQRLADNGLRHVLFNSPPGDWNGGERGLACVPGRQPEFRRGIETALEHAAATSCPRVHLMAGIVAEATEPGAARDTYLDNVAWAARRAGEQAVDVLIEPINTRDVPGFFLNRQDEAHAIVLEVGAPNLKVQMDLYHCQIVEGDVATKLRRYLPTGRVGHIQIAGVPDRHEPDTGELDHGYLFDVIDALAYDGWIGCEYRPKGGTSAGLEWFRRQA